MTNRSEQLLELAERCEKAEGLPAETAVLLDTAFALIHGEKPPRVPGGSAELSAWLALHNPFYRMLEADAFESAAFTLVPEGWDWLRESWETMLVYPLRDRDVIDYDRDCVGKAATPALALCAAALRSQSTQEGAEQ